MRKLAMVIGSVALFVVPLLAQAAESFPYVGELTGDRVRIRSGAGLNHQILTHVSTGSKVLVRGAKGEWLKVRVPQQASLWISAKYVTVGADGKTGTVKGTHVNVRARKVNGDVLGQVNTGDKLSVRGRDGDWLKIAPPDQVSGWIFGKYVRYLGPYADLKGNVEFEEQFNDLLGQARVQYQAELAKEPEQRDFTGVLALYDKMIAQAPSEAARAQAAAQRDFVASVKQINDSFIQAMAPYKGMPDKLAELEQKYQALFEQAAPPEYTVTGWVDTLGKIVFRPGTHKLVKDGKTICILKSDGYDLEEYRGKFVGVIGEMQEEKAWWGVPVMTVDQIDLLYDKGPGFEIPAGQPDMQVQPQ